MTDTKLLQLIAHLVCNNAGIMNPDDQFPHHSIYLRREGAKAILEGLQKEGMIFKPKPRREDYDSDEAYWVIADSYFLEMKRRENE